MTIRISKWQPNNQQARYYLNGLEGVSKEAKLWAEETKTGEVIIKSSTGHDIEIDYIYKILLQDGLISPEEDTKRTIDSFKVLCNKKSKYKEPAKLASTVLPIALKNEVSITIDHREPESIIDAFRSISGVTISVETLPSGDFSFKNSVVERKEASDFTQSIIDKRLFFQSDDLSEKNDKVLRAVILEGDPYSVGRISPNAIDGAISYLAVLQGLTILNSRSPQHTANIVARMASHTEHGLGYDVSYREAKPKTIHDQILFVTEGLPGIGVESSKLLMNHFKSLKNLFNADEKEIQKIEGFGKKKSEKIVQLINSVWLK